MKARFVNRGWTEGFFLSLYFITILYVTVRQKANNKKREIHFSKDRINERKKKAVSMENFYPNLWSKSMKCGIIRRDFRIITNVCLLEKLSDKQRRKKSHRIVCDIIFLCNDNGVIVANRLVCRKKKKHHF